MMKAIVIDDEPYSCQALLTLIGKHCAGIEIVASTQSPVEGLKLIRAHQPELLFLDIEMPHLNGFELLETLGAPTFQVIFTTSYDQYAIKALRFSALDYLLKPIDPKELQTAVSKALQRSTSSTIPAQLDILMEQWRKPASLTNRIALPTLDGLQMVQVDQIVSCLANSNYTTVCMKDHSKIVVSRTLKEIEEMLTGYSFLRIHHSSLVNLLEIKKYTRGEGGSVLLSDGTELDVSRSRKDDLLKKLQSGK